MTGGAAEALPRIPSFGTRVCLLVGTLLHPSALSNTSFQPLTCVPLPAAPRCAACVPRQAGRPHPPAPC